MTGEQWYNLLLVVVWLGFTLVVLHGLYRIVIRVSKTKEGE